jgi:hypothetical protein
MPKNAEYAILIVDADADVVDSCLRLFREKGFRWNDAEIQGPTSKVRSPGSNRRAFAGHKKSSLRRGQI